MIARIAIPLWLSAPDKSYDSETNKNVGEIGMLISIEKNGGEAPYLDRGTIIGGELDGWYATDLDEEHYQEVSPLELLAAAAE